MVEFFVVEIGGDFVGDVPDIAAGDGVGCKERFQQVYQHLVI